MTMTLFSTPDRTTVREFVLLRYVLIIAVSALMITQHGIGAVSSTTAVLVAAALASNVILNSLRPGRLSIWQIAGVIVVIDTLWISASLTTIGRVSGEFFFLYFFVLFFAALAENLVLMLVGVIGVSAAYLWVLAHLYPGSIWTEAYLLQIAFLFSAALFYGVLINRARFHRRRADLIEASDRARTELLATLAHDIGGPAQAITLGVEALQEKLGTDEEGGEARSLFGTVTRNSRYLNQLMQHFMEYARLRAGRYRLNPTQLSVNAVVERVAGQYEHQARLRGVRLELSLGAVPPAILDELCLARILDNLIGNAVRHTEPGTAVVVETAPEADGFRIVVGDSGHGLEPDQQKEIGDPFVDAVRTHGGVGLGLFIVRSLAEAHGGALTADSQPGRGARFTVRLPRVAVTAHSSAREEVPR
jgi:signal transduction histidine kinase